MAPAIAPTIEGITAAARAPKNPPFFLPFKRPAPLRRRLAPDPFIFRAAVTLLRNPPFFRRYAARLFRAAGVCFNLRLAMSAFVLTY